MKEATKRVLVAVVGIPVVLAAIWFGHMYFTVLVTVLALVGLTELYQLAEKKEIHPHHWVGYSLVIGIAACMLYNAPEFILPLLILALVYLLFIEMLTVTANPLMNISVTIFGIVYIGVFLLTLVGIRESGIYKQDQDMAYLVILLFAGVWICDTIAYLYGTKYGKHRLHEQVSPKKSVEGAVAGFIGSLIVYLVVYYGGALPEFSLKTAVLLSVIVGVFGQMGDLAESWLKREVAVKDSSSIIPGHGGVLDRFDSMLIVAPLTYLTIYFHLFS